MNRRPWGATRSFMERVLPLWGPVAESYDVLAGA
jgi:hypothetical protein